MSEVEKDASTIRTALVAARRGGASVRQVVEALEIAEKHRIPGTIAELRSRLHSMTMDPCERDLAVGKMLMFGVTAGILTHFILRMTRAA